jgi:hypothetical protein
VHIIEQGSTEVRDLGGLGNLARMWAELGIVLAIALGVLATHPRISASSVGAAIACSGEQPGSALPCTRPQSRRV